MRTNIDKYDTAILFYIKNGSNIAGDIDTSAIPISSDQRMIIKKRVKLILQK